MEGMTSHAAFMLQGLFLVLGLRVFVKLVALLAGCISYCPEIMLPAVMLHMAIITPALLKSIRCLWTAGRT